MPESYDRIVLHTRTKLEVDYSLFHLWLKSARPGWACQLIVPRCQTIRRATIYILRCLRRKGLIGFARKRSGKTVYVRVTAYTPARARAMAEAKEKKGEKS